MTTRSVQRKPRMRYAEKARRSCIFIGIVYFISIQQNRTAIYQTVSRLRLGYRMSTQGDVDVILCRTDEGRSCRVACSLEPEDNSTVDDASTKAVSQWILDKLKQRIEAQLGTTMSRDAMQGEVRELGTATLRGGNWHINKVDMAAMESQFVSWLTRGYVEA